MFFSQVKDLLLRHAKRMTQQRCRVLLYVCAHSIRGSKKKKNTTQPSRVPAKPLPLKATCRVAYRVVDARWVSSSFSRPSTESPRFSLLLASRGVIWRDFSRVELGFTVSLQSGEKTRQSWIKFFKKELHALCRLCSPLRPPTHPNSSEQTAFE